MATIFAKATFQMTPALGSMEFNHLGVSLCIRISTDNDRRTNIKSELTALGIESTMYDNNNKLLIRIQRGALTEAVATVNG